MSIWWNKSNAIVKEHLHVSLPIEIQMYGGNPERGGGGLPAGVEWQLYSGFSQAVRMRCTSRSCSWRAKQPQWSTTLRSSITAGSLRDAKRCDALAPCLCAGWQKHRRAKWSSKTDACSETKASVWMSPWGEIGVDLLFVAFYFWSCRYEWMLDEIISLSFVQMTVKRSLFRTKLEKTAPKASQ